MTRPIAVLLALAWLAIAAGAMAEDLIQVQIHNVSLFGKVLTITDRVCTTVRQLRLGPEGIAILPFCADDDGNGAITVGSEDGAVRDYTLVRDMDTLDY